MRPTDAARSILTDRAPPPAGHYAQAVLSGGMLYISGQLPVRPDGTVLADASFDLQATQALDNLLGILAAAGGAPAQLVRVTAYVVGVEHWPRFNALYAQRLGEARPARTIVPVPELHHGCLVEVDAIARIPQDQRHVSRRLAARARRTRAAGTSLG